MKQKHTLSLAVSYNFYTHKFNFLEGKRIDLHLQNVWKTPVKE